MEGAVPSVFRVGPLEDLLSPAVEDDGAELHQTLIFLGFVFIVDIVAVGREGIGHHELALADGHPEGREVSPVVFGIGDGVVALGVDGIEHDVVRAGLSEGVTGVLFIPDEVGLTGYRVLAQFREAPFIVCVPRTHVLGIGHEPGLQGCRFRAFGALGDVALGIGEGGGGIDGGYIILCPDGMGSHPDKGDEGKESSHVLTWV